MITKTYRAAFPTANQNRQRVTEAVTAAFMDNFVRALRRSGLCSWWQSRGCRESEIWKIEERFEILLPELYTFFLKSMGRGAGRFFQGTGIFYNNLVDNRRQLQKVLKADGDPFRLPKETFVFASSNGQLFHFFDTSECQDDPPVFAYEKGERHIKPIADSFSSYLIESLERQRTRWAVGKSGRSKFAPFSEDKFRSRVG